MAARIHGILEKRESAAAFPADEKEESQEEWQARIRAKALAFALSNHTAVVDGNSQAAVFPLAASASSSLAASSTAAKKHAAPTAALVPSYRPSYCELALVEQQKQKNRKYFVNLYADKFEPKEEENHTIVQVIPESHPEAIAEASATNTTTSLNIAPAEHDHNFCQVGGLPVTEEVRQAFTTGQAICTVTTLDNYNNGINPANFHPRGKVSSHLPPNLVGGIHKWGLVPLQSKLKRSKKANVWMGGVHALCWMAGYVIKNHPELLQGDNKLVCIVIPSGDPRLDLFNQFGAPGRYKDYVKPVQSPFIVPVFAKDTAVFPVNLIPHFLANAPHHPTVRPLLTEEQKREHYLASQRSYKEANRERLRAYQRTYNQSDARQCTFRDCDRQGKFSGMCSKHHQVSGGELPKSLFCFIDECEKYHQPDCMGMCISHSKDWNTEFEKIFY